MKNLKILISTLILSFALVSMVFAENNLSPEVTEALNLDENIKAEDLGVGDPTILPDSPFYFLKTWAREIRSLLALNPIAKARLGERFSSEKLMELKKLIEKNRNRATIEKGIENYQKELESMKRITERIRETAEENNQVGQFLDKFTQHQALHQSILEKLETQVPPEVYAKIEAAREEHLERFRDVMLKLEDKDKIADRLESNLEKIKGSDFKQLRNLEILNNLIETLPEDVKETIEQKKDEILERLRQKLEDLPPEKQEKLQQYLEKISGDKIKQLDVVSLLEGEELSEKLKEMVEKVRENYAEKIENKYQDTATSSEKAQIKVTEAKASLEKIKTIIIEKDITKEEVPAAYRLVEGAEEKLNIAQEAFEEGNYGRAFGQATASLSLSRNAIRIITIKGGFEEETEDEVLVCSSLEIVVCGTDGKTYQNICEAKKAGAKIAYRGECQTELPCAEEGKRVNRNPLLGPTNQVCCTGLEEIRVSKTYSVCKTPGVSFECDEDEDCPLSRCVGVSSRCVNNECVLPRCAEPVVCIQVIAPAKNLLTGECKEFPTPCDVPVGWIKVDECLNTKLRLK